MGEILAGKDSVNIPECLTETRCLRKNVGPEKLSTG